MQPRSATTAAYPAEPGGYEFDRATAVTALAGGRFAAEIHDGWDIGGNANGGYVLAVAARAMRDASGRPDPVTVTAHFLAPAPPGEVEISTEVVKAGKRFTTVSGSLVNGGRLTLRLLAAFGDQSGAAEERLYHEDGPPALPPFEECSVRSPSNGAVDVALMDKLVVRLHPDDAGFQAGVRSGRGEMRGWFAFADGRPIDTLGLLLAADAFPPAVFNLDLPPGWVPTVELTVHVRGVPAPGPLRCRFSTRFVQGGLFEEDGEVWDSDGRLVALSRQLALIARG